jgi:metal-responsive CopG/Arc/MetJ family transcriptional regulator
VHGGILVTRSYLGDTIRTMKVAISLPDPLFEAAELLADELHMPRSQLYAEALTAYLRTHGGAAITSRLNDVYGDINTEVDPAIAQAQLQVLDRETW